MPDAPAPTPVLSSTTTSRPVPRPRRARSRPRCQPVLGPWMPAPTTTGWTFSGSWLTGTSGGGLLGHPDRAAFLYHPRPGPSRSLKADPIGIPERHGDQVGQVGTGGNAL